MKTKNYFFKTGITFFFFVFVISLYGQDSYNDLYNKIEQAKKQNQYELSLGYNRKVIEITPKDNTFSHNFTISYAYYSMGHDLYNLGRYSEAFESFNSSYKYDDMHCYDMIAMCLERLEKYDDALTYYNKHIESYRTISKGQGITFTDEGYSYYKIYPKDLSTTLSRIGSIYSNYKKDYTKALELMNKAISLDHNNGSAFRTRAYIYQTLNRKQERIEDEKRVVLIGDNGDARTCAYNLSYLFFNEGNYKDAHFYIKSAIDHGLSQNAELYKMRGISAYKLQLYDDAVASYKRALELNPSIVIDQESKKNAEQFVYQKNEKKRQLLLAIETKRLNEIRNAGIGDKLIYSEGWYSKGGFFTPTTSWDMVVTCFIERKEGNNYQLRVGEVKSTDSNHYNSPTINGVKVSKGDIIWVKPLVGGKWIYSE